MAAHFSGPYEYGRIEASHMEMKLITFCKAALNAGTLAFLSCSSAFSRGCPALASAPVGARFVQSFNIRRFMSSVTATLRNEAGAGVAQSTMPKVKGTRGGNKPPIYEIDESERLFTADNDGVLLKDVQCFSLYHFDRIADPDAAARSFTAALGERALKDFAGTVYVAKEGFNAQLSVDAACFEGFEKALRAAAVAAKREGCTIDADGGDDNGGGGGSSSSKEDLELDVNMGALLTKGTPAPFKRFRVLSRPQILTDGLDSHFPATPAFPSDQRNHDDSSSISISTSDSDSRSSHSISSSDSSSSSSSSSGVVGGFDWRDAGQELAPEVWHAQLQSLSLASLAKTVTDPLNSPRTVPAAAAAEAALGQPGDFAAGVAPPPPPPPLLLDCRNTYESDVGMFAGAVPLGTDKFSDSWAALDEAVAKLPSKDSEVFTYCTGGIRCVKVGAYLKQAHGLTNVRRLKHGIIGYERWWAQQEREAQEEGEEAAAAAAAAVLKLEEEEEEASVSSDAAANAPQATGLFQGTNFIFDERPQPDTQSS